MLKNHLSGQNFQLTQAMNGEEAIKAIQIGPPFDLVLLDVMMPRMSGYESLPENKGKNTYPQNCRSLWSRLKTSCRISCRDYPSGANDYLPKPFHKEELLARINTHLDLHRIFNVAGRFVPNEFLHFT